MGDRRASLDELIKEKKVRPTIVVGIWNTPKRLQEYVPSKAFNGLPPQTIARRCKALYGGDPLSDGYLKFIVRELRADDRQRFNVKTDRANTSSWARRWVRSISLYAIDEYPQVFGGAGMMSTHWPLFLTPDGKSVSEEEYEVVSSAFERYLAPALPDPRLTSSISTMAPRLSMRSTRSTRIALTRSSRGAVTRQIVNWMTMSFPGQKHNEISWASRVAVPLQFLLAPVGEAEQRRGRARR